MSLGCPRKSPRGSPRKFSPRGSSERNSPTRSPLSGFPSWIQGGAAALTLQGQTKTYMGGRKKHPSPSSSSTSTRQIDLTKCWLNVQRRSTCRMAAHGAGHGGPPPRGLSSAGSAPISTHALRSSALATSVRAFADHSLSIRRRSVPAAVHARAHPHNTVRTHARMRLLYSTCINTSCPTCTIDRNPTSMPFYGAYVCRRVSSVRTGSTG